jgi:hypothetical protein
LRVEEPTTRPQAIGEERRKKRPPFARCKGQATLKHLRCATRLLLAELIAALGALLLELLELLLNVGREVG